MTDALAVAKGTLDVLVLRALSWAPMHGFEIIAWLEHHSGRELDVDDSSVYQAVYRMEQRGLVKASWGLTENNRRARYYAATKAGLAYLAAETEKWARYSTVVTTLLGMSPPAARNAR
jgi:PadR family transcriptional regulator PadR